jgi:hypothetical protein
LTEKNGAEPSSVSRQTQSLPATLLAQKTCPNSSLPTLVYKFPNNPLKTLLYFIPLLQNDSQLLSLYLLHFPRFNL